MPRKSPSKTSKAKEAARLSALRVSLGMTTRELAKEFQVAHVSISHWERGIRTIPGLVLRLIEIYEDKLPEKKKN